MIFNSSSNAPVIFKERLLWLLFLAPFFFLTYGAANQLVDLRTSVPNLMFAWEGQTPFIAEMIVPYMSLDLLFGFSFLLVKTRDEIQRHSLRIGLTIAISVFIFILFPLQCVFEKPLVDGWTQPIFAGLAADLPYNQLPSLHVSLSMIIGYIYYTHSQGFWRWFTVVWFSLIVLSTLLVYQHHFIDLPTGFLAGLLAFYFIPIKGKARFPLNFISPKHLHIAFRYLIGSIIFTVLAFKLNMLVWLMAWIALSLLILSCCYALAYNPIIKKNRGRIQWIYYFVFWPYLLGNDISWRIWKKKVPTMVEIDKGIWIGRSLDVNDKNEVQINKIKTIIDLTPEINDCPPSDCYYLYQPLLDLAIPNPQRLLHICQLIKENQKQGNVYIHCKFGLSRSVLVACAWLMMQGSDQKEAWDKVSKEQPKRVDRAYMHIALELFAEKIIYDE